MSEYEPYLISTGISIFVSSVVLILNNFILHRYLNGKSNQPAVKTINKETSTVSVQTVQTDDSLQLATATRTATRRLSVMKKLINNLKSVVYSLFERKTQSLKKLIEMNQQKEIVISPLILETYEQLKATIEELKTNHSYPLNNYQQIITFLHEQLDNEINLLDEQIKINMENQKNLDTAIVTKQDKKILKGDDFNLHHHRKKVKHYICKFNDIIINADLDIVKLEPFEYILYELEREEQTLLNKIKTLKTKSKKDNEKIKKAYLDWHRNI
jgi:hypothetical protein